MSAAKPQFTLSYQSRLPKRRSRLSWVATVIQVEGILLALPGVIWLLSGLSSITNANPPTIALLLWTGFLYLSPLVLGFAMLISGLGVKNGMPWAYVTSAILVSLVSLPIAWFAMVLIADAATGASLGILIVVSFLVSVVCFHAVLILALFHRQGLLKHHRGMREPLIP